MVISSLGRSSVSLILSTVRPERTDLVRLGLETAHSLLLVGIASRQYLNLLHWLPLLLAVVKTVCHCLVAKPGYGRIDAGGLRAGKEEENGDGES